MVPGSRHSAGEVTVKLSSSDCSQGKGETGHGAGF